MTAAAVILASLSGRPAFAQQTRQQIATEQRLAKSKEVKEIRRGKVEAALFKMTDDFKLERFFNPRKGFFVRFGVPGEGSGFGAGPAWRISNPTYAFTVSSAYTLSGNWIGDVTLRMPRLADERYFVDVSGTRIERPTEDFWGLGQQSSNEARTTYMLNQTSVQGTGGVRLHYWLTAGARTAFINPGIGRGRDKRFPSSTTEFTDGTAPGLTRQPTFMKYEAFLEFDNRDSIPPTRTALRLDQPPLGNARRGGRYYLAFSKYHDRELDQFSFRRVVVDLQQHIPILAGHRVIALRAMAITSEADAGHRVPFYFSPTIGGGNTLRGFSTFRFRDENLLLLQAEYRYHVNNFVSGGVFIDSGKVARRTRDLGLNGMETTYGFGVRLGMQGGAGLRADLAFGGKSPRLVLGFNNVF